MEPKSSILCDVSELALARLRGDVPVPRHWRLDWPTPRLERPGGFERQLKVARCMSALAVREASGFARSRCSTAQLAMFSDGRLRPERHQKLMRTLEPVFRGDGHVAGRHMLPSGGLRQSSTATAWTSLRRCSLALPDRHDSNITSLARVCACTKRAGGHCRPTWSSQILDQALAGDAPRFGG